MHNNKKSSSLKNPFLFSTAESIKTLCNHTRLIMGLEDLHVFALKQQTETNIKCGHQSGIIAYLKRLHNKVSLQKQMEHCHG